MVYAFDVGMQQESPLLNLCGVLFFQPFCNIADIGMGQKRTLLVQVIQREFFGLKLVRNEMCQAPAYVLKKIGLIFGVI